jgi:hypothetical protein
MVKLVRKYFNLTGNKNGMEDLIEHHQSSSVDEYIETFERLKSKLLLENHLFTVADFLDVFIRGLESELKAFVKALKPLTLDDVYDYALHMESVLESCIGNSSFPPNPVPFILQCLSQYLSFFPKISLWIEEDYWGCVLNVGKSISLSINVRSKSRY